MGRVTIKLDKTGQAWTNRPKREQLAPISLQAMLVTEEEPPLGVEPITWLLLTTLDINSIECSVAFTLAHLSGSLCSNRAVVKKSYSLTNGKHFMPPYMVRFMLRPQHQLWPKWFDGLLNWVDFWGEKLDINYSLDGEDSAI